MVVVLLVLPQALVVPVVEVRGHQALVERQGLRILVAAVAVAIPLTLEVLAVLAS